MGLGPSPGFASHSPRTASRRPSAMREAAHTGDPHTAQVWGVKGVTDMARAGKTNPAPYCLWA
eukprot:scaffold20562_cov69-Phaeocystis_antarctica.AAC.1